MKYINVVISIRSNLLFWRWGSCCMFYDETETGLTSTMIGKDARTKCVLAAPVIARFAVVTNTANVPTTKAKHYNEFAEAKVM